MWLPLPIISGGLDHQRYLHKNSNGKQDRAKNLPQKSLKEDGTNKDNWKSATILASPIRSLFSTDYFLVWDLLTSSWYLPTEKALRSAWNGYLCCLPVKSKLHSVFIKNWATIVNILYFIGKEMAVKDLVHMEKWINICEKIGTRYFIFPAVEYHLEKSWSVSVVCMCVHVLTTTISTLSNAQSQFCLHSCVLFSISKLWKSKQIKLTVSSTFKIWFHLSKCCMFTSFRGSQQLS